MQQRVLDAACTDAEMRARVLRMVRGANQDRDSSTGLAGRVVGGSTDNSDMLYFLARAYLATGRYRDAETTARELLALLTDKVSAQERSLGTAHLVLAEALAAQHRDGEALPHADAAVAIMSPSAFTPYAHELNHEALSLQSRLRAPTVPMGKSSVKAGYILSRCRGPMNCR